MKIFQATLSALAISQANGNAITCDIDSLISVICSAETGMKIDLDNSASDAGCTSFLTAGWNMRGFADSTTESSTTGCLLGTGVTETEYDTADFVSDTTCFDKETTAGNLVLSTNVYFYDADGNRAWSGVQASCSIAEAVTVTPLTLTVTESTYTDVNTDDTATELALQALGENESTTGTSFSIGQDVFFFVEENYSSFLDITLSNCLYNSDTVDSSFTFLVNDYESNTCSMANTYSFDSDYSGVTIQIYDDGTDTVVVSCTATLSFAA